MCMRRNTSSNSSTQRARSSDRQPRSRSRCFRDAFGWLVDPEIWLRACAIAALRERDGATTIELPDIPNLLGINRVHAQSRVVERADEDEREEPPNRVPTSFASGSRPAPVRVQETSNSMKHSADEQRMFCVPDARRNE